MTSSTATKIVNLLLLLLLLSLLHVTISATPTPPQSILNAAQTLSNSGFSAMSLSLHLLTTTTTTTIHGGTTTTTTTGKVSTTVLSQRTLTIFAPPDSAFLTSGQPPRSRLLLHISPLSLSLHSLSSLPFGTAIPTLSPASLVITTPRFSDAPVSINDVAVLGSPIYDDGSVIVFAVEDFFDSNFSVRGVVKMQKSVACQCSDISIFSLLFDAASRLKPRGYSIVGSFLELQVFGYLNSSPWPLKLTVFAPEDEVLLKFSGDIRGYFRLFMRHLLPCKLTYADINGVKNRTVFKENFGGLRIMIKMKDEEFYVNGVRITVPDMYVSDLLVIHGIGDAISQQCDGLGKE